MPEVYKYFKFEELYKEIKNHENGEVEEIIVEAGIGCNNDTHAMSLTTIYVVDNEVVYAEWHYNMKMGKCTCSQCEKDFHKLLDTDLGGFVLVDNK